MARSTHIAGGYPSTSAPFFAIVQRVHGAVNTRREVGIHQYPLSFSRRTCIAERVCLYSERVLSLSSKVF